MKIIKINIDPFELISVYTYKGIFQVNEHGYVSISGLIPSNKYEEYIQKAMTETWVQINGTDENGDNNPLFYGILKNFKIIPNSDGYILRLLIYTGTKLMDYTEHNRSFQKADITYKKAAECCYKDYSLSGMIMNEGRGSELPGFIMQCGETDWDFLKRLASILHTVLVPSYNVPGNKFFFGIPDIRAEGNLDSENYTIHQTEETFFSSDMKSCEKLFSYVVKSREVFGLGNCVPFNGKNLYIWRMETMLEGNELWHTYYLIKKSSIHTPRIYNNKVIGMSLMGRIENVEGEQVAISIDTDENYKSGTRWFPFSTIYSSPDGTGWYCMPEVGDAVRLYFPTADEAEAYVTSAYHENEGGGLRTNPENKIWRNKTGKEIRLTPDKILVTNNKGMSVELADHRGIKIVSNSSVTIEAADDISISSSNSNLEMAASSKIELKQGSTKMQLSEGIKLSGATIKMQ